MLKLGALAAWLLVLAFPPAAGAASPVPAKATLRGSQQSKSRASASGGWLVSRVAIHRAAKVRQSATGALPVESTPEPPLAIWEAAPAALSSAPHVRSTGRPRDRAPPLR